MKKIALFQLEDMDNAKTYSLYEQEKIKLNKSFSAFNDPTAFYCCHRDHPNVFSIKMVKSEGETVPIAEFYYATKNFLYGEIIESGKCLYGILGCPMYRKFSSTDLMLMVSNLDFNSLETSGKYPKFSLDKSGWDKALMAKLKY